MEKLICKKGDTLANHLNKVNDFHTLMGNIYESNDGSYYIVSQIGYNGYTLISLDGGNRYRDPFFIKSYDGTDYPNDPEKLKRMSLTRAKQIGFTSCPTHMRFVCQGKDLDKILRIMQKWHTIPTDKE